MSESSSPGPRAQSSHARLDTRSYQLRTREGGSLVARDSAIEDSPDSWDRMAAAQGKDSGKNASSDKNKDNHASGIIRRASVSLKGLLGRRQSLLAVLHLDDSGASSAHTPDGEETVDLAAGPSRPRAQSHHNLLEGKSDPSRDPTTTTSKAPPLSWTRLRKAANSRYTRRASEGALPNAPGARHTSTLPQPGNGSEPPVIPSHTGLAARASAAAWHSEQQHPSDSAEPLQHEDHVRDKVSDTTTAMTSNDMSDEDAVFFDVPPPSSDAPPQFSRKDFIGALPRELAIQILGHLNAHALVNASSVCKIWQSIISDSFVWRNSFLAHQTSTFAGSSPIKQGSGHGVPANGAHINWKTAYMAKTELDGRWKDGRATPIHLSGHTDSVYCLQFDDNKIISGSRDLTIRIWDMHTFACKLVIGPPHVISKQSLLFHDDGILKHQAKIDTPCVPVLQSIVGDVPPTPSPTAQSSPILANSRISKGSLPSTVCFDIHHLGSILCLQYDDEILVTGSSDGTCIIYDLTNGYRPTHRLRHHAASVLDLVFDSEYIVTGSKDETICVWSRHTGVLVKQLFGHRGPVNGMQIRGGTIISCSSDTLVKLWNIKSGKLIRDLTHTDAFGLACCQSSEDGRFVAAAGKGRRIRIWDANSGDCVRELKAHDQLIRTLHLDSVSGRLISGSYDTDMKVFDLKTGQQILDFPKWHPGWVLSAKSDYRRIVTSGQGWKILILDFGRGVDGIGMLESTKGSVKDVAY